MQQHQVLQSWMRNLYPQVAIQERLHSLERLTWRCPESRMLWDDPRRRRIANMNGRSRQVVLFDKFAVGPVPRSLSL